MLTKMKSEAIPQVASKYESNIFTSTSTKVRTFRTNCGALEYY